MAGKEVNIWREIVHRFRFKYRVSVLNENTLEEAWHVRLSRLSLFVYSGLFFVISFILLALLIVYTPIRNYLPGVINVSGGTDIQQLRSRVDSLDAQFTYQTSYFDVLRDIVSGDVVVDSAHYGDLSTGGVVHTDLLPASPHEMDFRERYEEDNAYAVNGDDDVLDADKLLLFRIADGVVEPDQEGDGVVVLSAEGSAVMSVLEGVVVDIYYDINHEWSIVVQHIDGYVSVYHGLHKPLVTVGEKLVAGDVLSTAGSAGRVTFVLWHDGNVVDLSQLL